MLGPRSYKFEESYTRSFSLQESMHIFALTGKESRVESPSLFHQDKIELQIGRAASAVMQLYRFGRLKKRQNPLFIS